MALYGMPYGAMNPEAHQKPTGPTPEEEQALRQKSQAAQAEWQAQNPGPFSAAANAYYSNLKAQQHDGTTSATAGPPKDPEPTQEKMPEGIPMPDPKEDPGGAIITTAMNRGAGMGNGTGLVKMPKRPSAQENMVRAAEEEGKQTLFDMNKIPKPMESNAFNMGLLSFGLNLLSGNDMATSFNQAGAHFQQAYGREKREIWAQDLVDQGYDAQDIQRWIETGDNNDLKDPMDKKMKMQQYRMGQEQLSKIMYENSDEMRQFALDKDYYTMEMEQAKFQSQQNFQNENLKIAQTQANIANERLKLEQRQYSDKQAAAVAGKPDPKMFMSGALTAGLNYSDVIKSASYMPSAGDYAKVFAIDQLPEFAQEYAKQSWTPEMHAANQMRNQVSEMIGRALSGAALSETKERPTWANALLPTPQEIANNDVNALKRKENVFNALKVYANTFAEKGQGALAVNDVQMLSNGSAQMLVDSNTGIPVGIQYQDGKIKQF